ILALPVCAVLVVKGVGPDHDSLDPSEFSLNSGLSGLALKLSYQAPGFAW
ncbi:unnamed protein product, partial [marine sediment metagenome]